MDHPTPPQDYYGADLPTSTLAIISLVTGLFGFAFPIIFSLAALVTGYVARRQTRADPPKAKGDGLATAGIFMGWFQIGLTVFVIACFMGLYLVRGDG